MKTLLYLSLTLAACRLFAQPTNPGWTHLPPDAAAIYDFNLKALTAKIPWYALAAPIPAPQRHTANRTLVSILRRPDNAGVDVRHDLFIIVQTDTCKTTSFLLELVDTARWSAFLKTQSPDQRLAIAYNHRFAVLTYLNVQPDQGHPVELRRLALRRSQNILKGYDSSSCIREPLFRSGFSDDADIRAWTRHGQLVHALSTIRFERGRILLTSIIDLPPGADSPYTGLLGQLLTQLRTHGRSLRDSIRWIGQLLDTFPPSLDSMLVLTPRTPSAPLSGYLDCKALSAYYKDLPLLSAMDKLNFSAGRLNTSGQIENTFELTLLDPRAYSLQTLWPLLGP